MALALGGIKVKEKATTVVESVCKVFTYLNPHLYFQWQPLQDVNHDVTREMDGPDLEDQRMWLHKLWVENEEKVR